jgi:SAM-dependent methyltransferase
MRSREEWEQWYRHPDPWRTEGSDDELLRAEAILSRLRGKRFRHVLELGCGEGNLADALAAVADRVTGYDISENALARARRRFPHIEFGQGDLLDVVQRPEIKEQPFDFIVTAEVLSYFQTDTERRQAIAGIAGLGVAGYLYYFSVIVMGASAGRRYFTHDEFTRMLSEKFRIIEHFPSAVVFSPVVDRVLHAMPFRRARMSWQQRKIRNSDPSRWKHVGYFAMRHDAASPESTH